MVVHAEYNSLANHAIQIIHAKNVIQVQIEIPVLPVTATMGISVFKKKGIAVHVILDALPVNLQKGTV